jgi:hypothetical protein
LFSDASLPSLNIVKAALLKFENISCLKVNPSKSSFYCSGVSSQMKAILLDELHMQERMGTWPKPRLLGGRFASLKKEGGLGLKCHDVWN